MLPRHCSALVFATAAAAPSFCPRLGPWEEPVVESTRYPNRVWDTGNITRVGDTGNITRVGDTGNITRVGDTGRITRVGDIGNITRVGIPVT